METQETEDCYLNKKPHTSAHCPVLSQFSNPETIEDCQEVARREDTRREDTTANIYCDDLPSPSPKGPMGIYSGEYTMQKETNQHLKTIGCIIWVHTETLLEWWLTATR